MKNRTIPGTNYHYFIDDSGKVISHTAYGDVFDIKPAEALNGKLR